MRYCRRVRDQRPMFSRENAIMKETVCFGLIVFLLVVLSSVAGGQEIHHPHCLHGCPAGSPRTNDLIIREIYILSSNDLTKFADWAAYKVTKGTIGPSQQRTWKADPLLAEHETLEPEDYKDAHAVLGVDRGHQVPLASFSGTPYWQDTNYLSNITPQKSALNQGPWAKLEQAVRDLAQKDGVEGVYGMTGPLFERIMPQLPNADEPHVIPSGYWKIVAVQEGNTVKLAGFILDQETPRGANSCSGLTTVDNIEQRTGLAFFHALPKERQAALERETGTLAPVLGCGESAIKEGPAREGNEGPTVTGAPAQAPTLGNKRSKIYHLPGCPGYDRISEANRVEFKTRKEAEASGFRAARNC